MNKDFFFKDVSASLVFHIAFLLLIPLIKFSPPLKFVEVSLIAQTSTIPQNLRRITRKQKAKRKRVRVWTPGEGEPLPAAKISPQKEYEVQNPEITDENKPQISDVRQNLPIETPQPEKIVPSFGKATGKSFEISGPVSSRSVLRKVYPKYPKAAQLMGISGDVVIKFWVSPDGIIEKTVVEKTSGSDILDAAALGAIKKWLFAPIPANENHITQWGLLTVRFELK